MEINYDHRQWVSEWIFQDIMFWSHPAGDDAHLCMSKEDYDHELSNYYYELKNCRDRIYRDWSSKFRTLKNCFLSKFGFAIGNEEIITIFMDKLAEYCIK